MPTLKLLNNMCFQTKNICPIFYRVFIDDLKEVQKLRRRQHGISLDDLSAVPTTERPANVKVTIFMSYNVIMFRHILHLLSMR